MSLHVLSRTELCCGSPKDTSCLLAVEDAGRLREAVSVAEVTGEPCSDHIGEEGAHGYQ